MKRLLLSAILFSFITLAMAQERTENPSLVNVNGEYTTTIEPDGAVVNIAVSTTNKDLLLAKQENDKIASKALAFLKNQSIKEKDIRTTRLDLQPYNEYVKDQKPEQYYRAQQSITFTVSDLNTLPQLLSGLVEQGVNTIQSVQFTTSKLQELQNLARAEAVKDAKAKAEILAQALDQRIGKAKSISDNTYTNAPSPIAFRAYAKAADASVEQAPVATGEIEVKANVTVSFILLD